jgi:hypothetical protein
MLRAGGSVVMCLEASWAPAAAGEASTVLDGSDCSATVSSLEACWPRHTTVWHLRVDLARVAVCT